MWQANSEMKFVKQLLHYAFWVNYISLIPISNMQIFHQKHFHFMLCFFVNNQNSLKPYFDNMLEGFEGDGYGGRVTLI